jgi:hypothetical protein
MRRDLKLAVLLAIENLAMMTAEISVRQINRSIFQLTSIVAQDVSFKRKQSQITCHIQFETIVVFLDLHEISFV